MRRTSKASDAYAELIENRWYQEYLPQWNSRLKWNQMDSEQLKNDELEWSVADSSKCGQYKKTDTSSRSVPRIRWYREILDCTKKIWCLEETISEAGTDILRGVFREAKQFGNIEPVQSFMPSLRKRRENKTRRHSCYTQTLFKCLYGTSPHCLFKSDKL